jgi:hypothetical protein
MRALIAFACLALVAGCGGTRACRDGTILVNVTLNGAAAGADNLAITTQIGGGAAKPANAPLQPGTTAGTIEITFPGGYPSGQTVTITVEAQSGGSTVATTSGAVTLSSSCGNLSLDFAGGGGDGGGPDACIPATTCPATVHCGKVDDGCGGKIDCGPCQLFSLEPTVASTSDTVYLEGIFGENPAVVFPGGATANATVLGPNRLSAQVPGGVGHGDITVASGGVSTNPVAFRRASYVVGLGPFQTQNDQADYGHQMSQLVKSRWGAAAAATSQQVYVFGGASSSEKPVADGEQAMVNGDGSLGAFVPIANPMSVARVLFSAVRVGNSIYVIGGRNGMDKSEASVERAQINPDGTLGAFTMSSSLTTSRFSHAAAVIGDYLYVFGGLTGPKCGPPMALNTVERAPIMADGSLGAFADTGVTMATPRTDFAVVVAGNYLYAVGGGGAAALEVSPIAADGSLMGFFSATATLNKSVWGAYVIGGKLHAITDHVFVANFNSDGTLQPFAQGPQIGSNMVAHALVGNWLYLFGGGEFFCCSACFASSPGVTQRASLNGGTGLTAFAIQSAATPKTQRTDPMVAVLGQKVWLVGGQAAGMGDVEAAPLKSDGTIGAFDFVTGSTLKTKLTGMAGAVVGNFFYVVGGLDGTNTAQTLVQVAPIAADGTLGAFDVAKANGTGAAVVLSTARARAGLVALTKRLCAVGGSAASFECATINADGTLAGNFTNGGTLVATGSQFAPAALGPTTVYLAGPGNFESNTYDVNGQPGAAFANVSGVSGLIGIGAAFVVGNNLFEAGGFTGLDTTQQVTRFPLDPTSLAPGAGSASASTLTFKRDGHVAVLLGNTVVLLGGTTAGGAADTEVAELR